MALIGIDYAGSGGSSVTWGYWVSTNYTTSSTASTFTTTGNVWSTWVTLAPTSSSSATITVAPTWGNWVETEAQRAAREALAKYRYPAEPDAEADRVWRLEQEKLAALKAEADARAEKLLLEWLAHEEAERYRRAGYFYVMSESGKKYKIKKGSHGNVYLIDPETEKEKVSYCVQPGGVPVGDVNLSQALFLKHAEADFLKAANARQLN